MLKIATCQFGVNDSVKRNAKRICDFLRKAKKARADIVHFSECALSGYVGTDFPNFAGYDWNLLKAETEKIMALAAKLKLWVVLGSTHRLTESNKPHNSLYLINAKGKIVDRYDKRFCTPGDLRRLTPGSRFVNFTIKGVKCSLL
ncbi:MAG: carbon-nitrogen hydrolase family protein, partial [Planctomycetota bacterium]